MGSTSNGGLAADGNPNKRLLGNGYHSLITDVMSKYKPRKVSSARDFPPGCGRQLQQIGTEPQDDLVAQSVGFVGGSVEANSVDSYVAEVGVRSLETVNIPVQDDMNLLLDEMVNNAQAFSTDGVVNKVEHMVINVPPLGLNVPNGVENDEMLLAKEGNKGKDKNLDKEMEEVGGKVVFENVGPEMVNNAQAFSTDGVVNQVEQMVINVPPLGLDVPNGVENDEMLLAKEENKGKDKKLDKEMDEVGGKVVFENVGPEETKPMLENGATQGALPINSVKSCSPPYFSVCNGHVKEETVPSPKDKFRTRRVSAVRDFPPFCGRYAPPPIKEEQFDVASGENTLVVWEQVGSITGAVETSRDDVERGLLANKATAEVEPRETSRLDMEDDMLRETTEVDVERLEVDVQDGDLKQYEPENILTNDHDDSFREIEGKEIVLYSSDDKNDNNAPISNVLENNAERIIVHALMAPPSSSSDQGKVALSSPKGGSSKGKSQKSVLSWRRKGKAVAKKSVVKSDPTKGLSKKQKLVSVPKTVVESSGSLILKEKGGLPADCARRSFDVQLPPFGPHGSTHGDARNKVRETLRLFQAICRKLLQGEESKTKQENELKAKQSDKASKRIDLQAAKMIKEKGKEVNTGMQLLGAVPGVEVGDEFQYRVELAIVGVHRLYQAGIDSMKHGGELVATSIVASGGYADDLDNADSLIYSGQGGIPIGKDKQAEDQKLERGNLALYNSISVRNPVRVIRGSKETKASDSLDGKPKMVTTYVYDGLYTVERYWTETGSHGKLVFMFELKRIPGQPELAWKEVKKSKKYKVRPGLCVDDIAEGKEFIPISAINTIDDEKPPPFTYITEMMYPDWYCKPAEGCDCTGKCSGSRKCLCAAKNGGEIPYNYNGAIVEAKPLVYECGPSCKCPPSCYNRVSQHGIKIPLEIFKTESRGWGVRSLTSISSGSFVCEYLGELLEDKEAEQRSNDEYLFDIGQNYSDCSVKPDGTLNSSEAVEDGGYTIDAAQYGNVGRFVNHSCSPNLYAQNVLYDHGDKKMPHIMLFAAENIPPLQELTYHYNYTVDQVLDSNGNIKKKSCFCGSAECTGRLY